MTELQKSRIRSLREQGTGFAEIARQMDIPRETVKSFCRRNGVIVISEALPVPSTMHEKGQAVSDSCRACGKTIEQIGGRKKRVFCCDQCRTNWWRRNQDKIRRRETALYSFTCAGCGREFTAYGNQHRKYCSHECYIRTRFGTEDVQDGNDG